MAMEQKDIVMYLKDSFPDGEIILKDLMGDQDHYSLYIKSALFKGKSRIQQHQMVYAALKGHMGNALHALALKTESME